MSATFSRSTRFTRIAIGSVIVLVGLFLMLGWGAIFPDDGDNAETLMMYCAAGIRKPAEEIAKQYEEEYDVRIEFSFRGSGALLSDMRAAGKGDVYLAASNAYVEEAQQRGLARESMPVAFLHPVVCIRKDLADKVHSIEDVLDQDLRISLADPEVAAISRAARKQLEGTGLWEKLWEAKLVSVDTVNRVANDIVTGAADAGIVWDATAAAYDELAIIRVPEFEKNPKQIKVAVLESSKHPTASLRFLRYFTARDKGLQVFKRHGYEVVEGDKWARKPTLTVFAGGLNRPAIEKTIDDFAEREGVEVIDSYNGCGILVGQIKTQKTPDMYFACDTSFMTEVADVFVDPVNVSSTRMVIIVRKDRQDELQIEELEDLGQEGVRLGVCHPEKSALGALTKRLLENHGLYSLVQKNVRDTPATADLLVTQVVAGGLEAGIVYEANTTLQKDKLEVLQIPDAAAMAVQPIAVSTKSDYPQLTSRLVEEIRSAKSQAHFQELGFSWLDEPQTP